MISDTAQPHDSDAPPISDDVTRTRGVQELGVASAHGDVQ